MVLYSNILQYMYIVDIQYLSEIPNRRRIWNIGSCYQRPKWSNLTLSTYFKVLPYNIHRIKVDDILPQHTSRLVHSRFIKSIGNFSVDVEIYHVSVRYPLIRLPIYKGPYKENLVAVYLYIYRTDSDFVWRLFISITNTSI